MKQVDNFSDKKDTVKITVEVEGQGKVTFKKVEGFGRVTEFATLPAGTYLFEGQPKDRLYIEPIADDGYVLATGDLPRYVRSEEPAEFFYIVPFVEKPDISGMIDAFGDREPNTLNDRLSKFLTDQGY